MGDGREVLESNAPADAFTISLGILYGLFACNLRILDEGTSGYGDRRGLSSVLLRMEY